MRRRLQVCLVTVAAFGSGGCIQPVAVPKWEPLDPVQLQQPFDNPTATFAEASVVGGDLFVAFEDNKGTLDAIDRFVTRLRRLTEGTGDGTTGGSQAEVDGVSGTAVFLELSCPGMDLANPVVDFSQGTLRIDGPRITREVIERASVEGNLLFTFLDCVDERAVIEGEARAFYDFDNDETVWIDYEATVTPPGGVDPIEFDFPAVYRTDEVAYLLATPQDTVFVFAYDPAAPLTFEMRVVEGIFDCNTVTGICTQR